MAVPQLRGCAPAGGSVAVAAADVASAPPPPPAFRRYGTFILARKQPGGDKMRGFTRILHRTKLDAPVSDEVGRWLPREGSLQASSNVPQAPSARRLGPMQ